MIPNQIVETFSNGRVQRTFVTVRNMGSNMNQTSRKRGKFGNREHELEKKYWNIDH